MKNNNYISLFSGEKRHSKIAQYLEFKWLCRLGCKNVADCNGSCKTGIILVLMFFGFNTSGQTSIDNLSVEGYEVFKKEITYPECIHTYYYAKKKENNPSGEIINIAENIYWFKNQKNDLFYYVAYKKLVRVSKFLTTNN